MEDVYVRTTLTAEAQGLTCCVCGCKHRKKVWQKAYLLSARGKELGNISAKGDSWCCSRTAQQLGANNKEKPIVFVDETNKESPVLIGKTEHQEHIDNNTSNLLTNSSTPDYTILSTTNVVDFVHNFGYCYSCKATGCLLLNNITTSGLDSKFFFRCQECGYIITLESSNPFPDSNRKILSSKLMTAASLSGIGVTELSKMLSLTGIASYSNMTTVYESSNKLWNSVTALAEESFEQVMITLGAFRFRKHIPYAVLFDRDKLYSDRLSCNLFVVPYKVYDHNSDQLTEQRCCVPMKWLSDEVIFIIFQYVNDGSFRVPVYSSIDGRWSKARNANECTVTFIEIVQKIPIYRFNVVKVRTNNGKGYVGSSKCAEGFGIERILEWIVDRKFLKCFDYQLIDFAHDHDGSTRNIILKYFPNSRELFDPKKLEKACCKGCERIWF